MVVKGKKGGKKGKRKALVRRLRKWGVGGEEKRGNMHRRKGE